MGFNSSMTKCSFCRSFFLVFFKVEMPLVLSLIIPSVADRRKKCVIFLSVAIPLLNSSCGIMFCGSITFN